MLIISKHKDGSINYRQDNSELKTPCDWVDGCHSVDCKDCPCHPFNYNDDLLKDSMISLSQWKELILEWNTKVNEEYNDAML